MPTLYLTVEQLAERLGVAPRDDLQVAARGRRRPSRTPVRQYLRFALADVETWEKARRERPAPRGAALKFR